MKIYNIDNTKELFDRLAACQGTVRLVGETGEPVEIQPGKFDKSLLPMLYVQGTIKQMELLFEKTRDCERIFNYLVNKRGTAA